MQQAEPTVDEHFPDLGGKPNPSHYRIHFMAETPNIKRSCISRIPYNRGNTGLTSSTTTPPLSPKPTPSRGRSTTTRSVSTTQSTGTSVEESGGSYQSINIAQGQKIGSVRVNRNLVNEEKEGHDPLIYHPTDTRPSPDVVVAQDSITINQKLNEFDQKKYIQSIDSASTSSAFKPSQTSIATTSLPADDPNEDLISTTGPSACSAFELAGTTDLQDHSVDPLPINGHSQITFDPIVRIIPNPGEENSSDEETPTRRSRSRTKKRPVRLCTRKIALPLNISTSSLIGIGYHNNHSNASLTPSSPSGVVSSRELFAQTRKEIDEDEQFIPDVPRYLNLTLPRITRQPDRRALRLEEEHRLARWRQTGRYKSNLKPNTFSNLSHLSPSLREQLNKATVPVQLSTNTAINSIASSISPRDDLNQYAQSIPFPKQVTSADSNGLLINSEPVGPLASPTHDTISNPKLRPPHVSNSFVKQTISAESKSHFPLEKNGRRTSRFRWFGQKARSIGLDSQRNDSGNPEKSNTSSPAESNSDSSGAPLQKSPTPAWLRQSSLPVSPDQPLDWAPLKRVSTPRGQTQGAMISGVPLQRTATPATSLQRPSATPLQHSSTLGAPLKKTSTPGAALQRSATTTTLLSKTKYIPFVKKLAIWPKTPLSSNRIEPTIDPASDFVDDTLVISANPPPHTHSRIRNLSNASLMLPPDGKIKPSFPTDKWGSRTEVPLRECCQVCLSSANVEAGTSNENQLSSGALKHYYKKSWILQDTLRQGGIPYQFIKLISAELGTPYPTWVAQVPNP